MRSNEKRNEELRSIVCELVAGIMGDERIASARAVEFVLINNTKLMAVHMIGKEEVDFVIQRLLDGFEIMGALLLDGRGQLATIVFGLELPGEDPMPQDVVDDAREEILSFRDTFLRRCKLSGEMPDDVLPPT